MTPDEMRAEIEMLRDSVNEIERLRDENVKPGKITHTFL